MYKTLTVFYPTDKLFKLKLDKAFILRPGMMYCQVRSCVCMRGENTNAFHGVSFKKKIFPKFFNLFMLCFSNKYKTFFEQEITKKISGKI